MRFATVLLSAALALAFAFAVPAYAAKTVAPPPVPLTIKGVAIGDTREQGSQVGVCDAFIQGSCIGNTSFGPAQNAEFMVQYLGGRVNVILVTFEPRYAQEVLAGLTRKFGQPQSCPDRVNEVRCHVYMTPGVNLTLVEDVTRTGPVRFDHVGSLILQRAAPADNF